MVDISAGISGSYNLQFTNVTVNGTLIVPSGTFIQATGNVTVTGTITVLPAAADTGGSAHPGISLSPATTWSGGTGLTALQAAQVTRIGLTGGGAGAIPNPSGAIQVGTGGQGGGSLLLAAQGNINVASGALISADGAHGVNPQTAGVGILGPGGGGGGVIVLVAKGTLAVAGTLSANGGNGANGFDGNGGDGEGGGGGGGGGIVHLLTTSAPSVTGTISVAGGSGGANATGIGSNITRAGGGGASGGRGGNPGAQRSGGPLFTPQAGAAGHSLQTITSSPENRIR